MGFSLNLPVWTIALFLGFVTYNILWKIKRQHDLNKFGVKPKMITRWWTFGIDHLIDMTKTTKTKRAVWVIQERFKQRGNTWSLYILGRYTIGTIEPENIKALLATQFEDFGKGYTSFTLLEPFLGRGIFATDGHDWSTSRKLLRPFFTKERRSDLDIFDHFTQILVSLIPKDGSPVNIQDIFFRYTLDVSTKFLLGHAVGALDYESKKGQEFSDNFALAQDEVVRRMKWIFVGKYFMPRKSVDEAVKGVNKFIEPYIDRALEDREKRIRSEKPLLEDGEGNFNFLDALSESTNSRTVLRDEINSILLAGRDTTAGTLSFLFMMLSEHPRVYEKLRHEIIERLGESDKPSYRDLKDMKYLQRVLNETLRLFPIVPGNQREALKDTSLPKGGGPNGDLPIQVPKGRSVMYNVFTMHRREDLWGSDAAEFRPERWEQNTNPWYFVPFNAGPRICLGQQFALEEMSYAVIRILQTFKECIALRSEAKPKMHTALTLSTLEGVHVAFK